MLEVGYLGHRQLQRTEGFRHILEGLEGLRCFAPLVSQTGGSLPRFLAHRTSSILQIRASVLRTALKQEADPNPVQSGERLASMTQKDCIHW